MAPDICRGGSRKWNFLGWMKFVSCYQLELYRRIFGSFSFFKREARVLIFYGRGSLLMNFNRSNDTWALIKLDRLSFSVLHLFATFLSFNLCQLYTAYIPWWNRIFGIYPWTCIFLVSRFQVRRDAREFFYDVCVELLCKLFVSLSLEQ